MIGSDPVRWARGYMVGGVSGPMEHRSSAFGYDGIGTIGFADPARRYSFAYLRDLLDLSPT